ncbi:MAG: hypothetical protein OXK16_11650 [bacterium]|nr:hypothetical protein [bacterium]
MRRIALVVGTLVMLLACGGTEPDAGPVVARLSAEALFEEREANATRFDAEYKGKRVTVYGTIDRIDNGKVYLEVSWLSDVVLDDLTDEEMIPLNAGDQFTATCVVGNFVMAQMFLDDCLAG